MKTPMRVRRRFRKEVCEQARVLAEAPSLELASAFKATLEQRATYLTRQNLEAVQGSLETVLAGTDDSDHCSPPVRTSATARNVILK